jgi:hypothetical protein
MMLERPYHDSSATITIRLISTSHTLYASSYWVPKQRRMVIIMRDLKAIWSLGNSWLKPTHSKIQRATSRIVHSSRILLKKAFLIKIKSMQFHNLQMEVMRRKHIKIWDLKHLVGAYTKKPTLLILIIKPLWLTHGSKAQALNKKPQKLSQARRHNVKETSLHRLQWILCLALPLQWQTSLI